MKTLLELYQFAEHTDVSVDDFPLPANASLAVMADSGECHIAIDARQVRGEPDEKVKLAHELGHCVTGSFYNQYSPFDELGKHEKRANIWSYKNLVPFDELNDAVTSGLIQTWELAEHFDVPEEYVRGALKYYLEDLGLRFYKAKK